MEEIWSKFMLFEIGALNIFFLFSSIFFQKTFMISMAEPSQKFNFNILQIF